MKEDIMKIGDEWTAIQLIARSQTNPQKAIAEFVENSLDARASKVLIERLRYNRKPALYVKDNGGGFPLNSEGIPDVEGTPKRICDSLKRKLAEAERKGIHGEFGIGLLGFWSIGEDIIIFTKGKETKTFLLEMKAGERRFRWDRVEKKRIIDNHGTVLIIYPVRKEIQNRLTAEKLAKYLGEELRDRIRTTGAEVIVKDRIRKKEMRVRPIEFPGEPLREIESLAVEGYQPIKVELYWSLLKEGEVPQVALCKDGTRVIKDILELDEFQCLPWNSRRLIGVLDFPAFKLAPTTRAGIVPDDAYKAFVTAVKGIEPLLIKLLEEKEREKEEEANKEILKALQKAFVEAFNELPDEYTWFDISGKELPDEKPPRPPVERPPKPPESTPDIQPGSLHEVVVVPRYSNVPFHSQRKFVVRAYDVNKVEIAIGVEFEWRVIGSLGFISNIGEKEILFTAGGEEGIETIEVTATQGEIKVRATATAIIGRERPERDRGFPPYEPNYQPLEGWRSRWVEDRKVIEVNTGHEDHLSIKGKGKVERLYLARLYAKELVMLNFPDFPKDQILERLVEVLTHLEGKL